MNEVLNETVQVSVRELSPEDLAFEARAKAEQAKREAEAVDDKIYPAD